MGIGWWEPCAKARAGSCSALSATPIVTAPPAVRKNCRRERAWSRKSEPCVAQLGPVPQIGAWRSNREGIFGDVSVIVADRGHEGSPLLLELEAQLTELPALVELVSRAIVDEPPLSLKEGGVIRGGFDAALDELHVRSREVSGVAHVIRRELTRLLEG